MTLELFHPFSSTSYDDWDQLFEPSPFTSMLATRGRHPFSYMPLFARERMPRFGLDDGFLSRMDEFPSSSRLMRGSSFPRVEEDETKYTWSVAVPGMNSEDISIEVKDNVLQVRGTHKEVTRTPKASKDSPNKDKSEAKEDKDKTKEAGSGDRMEVDEQMVSSRSFHYQWNIGDNVKLDEMTASIRNGVLALTGPKKVVEKPGARAIPITLAPADDELVDATGEDDNMENAN